ncbi:DNA-binding protein [Candidatus Micrarchaeota archaeon]|nr:DNA-binding protein [Candidatus Micrarchaeota archaeon]
MNISELSPGTSNVEVQGEIVEIETPREFNKNGRQLRVANAVLRDESGTISLVLWNDEIDKVQPGNVVKITNGYVNVWRDTPQLTLGKLGKMEVVQ